MSIKFFASTKYIESVQSVPLKDRKVMGLPFAGKPTEGR
jgi:hypothetical protein